MQEEWGRENVRDYMREGGELRAKQTKWCMIRMHGGVLLMASNPDLRHTIVHVVPHLYGASLVVNFSWWSHSLAY